MPSLSRILREHSPLLLIDAASARIQVGLLLKPYAGHGTFVAGVMRCIAPAADIFVGNVFRTGGSGLETEFAADVGCTTPLFTLTQPVYTQAMAMGLGDQDTAAVFEVLKKTIVGTPRS